MSLLNVDAVEPEGATTELTLGSVGGGDKVTIPGTIKISGGTPGADKVLTSDASGDATWEAASSAGFIGYTVYTGDATWLKSANSPTKVVVEVQGAAGGGGGSHGVYGTSGGTGGAGGYTRKFINVSSVTEADIVVGDGGAGGAHASPGVAGANSSWDDQTSGSGSSILTGGGGALGGNAGVAQGAGGIGGVATGGDLNIPGTNGSTNTVGPRTGAGAFYGSNNVQTGVTSAPGLPGVGYGGPGSGGTGGTTAGGAGTDGVVIVWEYA